MIIMKFLLPILLILEQGIFPVRRGVRSLVVAAVVRRFGRIIIIIVGAQLPFQIVRWHHSEQVHAHD